MYTSNLQRHEVAGLLVLKNIKDIHLNSHTS